MITHTAAKPLTAFAYVTFDVVGTLIDFEDAIIRGLAGIAAGAGAEIDGEDALKVYRAARYQPDAGLFPDDLGRCYGQIAAALGLPDTPQNRQAMIDAVAEAKPFPDSVEAMARLKKHYRLIAMTNARRWAFEKYEEKLGFPFWASFTTDETGTEKPDPVFFEKVFHHVEAAGAGKGDILHTAQSQYHDIGISRQLGMSNAWIERRHAQKGYGGTIAPESFTEPDYHFHALIELAEAADSAFEE
ncbi:putative hydrolase of the HAD superfamily [Breoghania corrubedonensis]|uniref:Putative hydrolase of the HAD superfamily n=1 Tax=Breoghania corrubedonensis TaxID=665038 RepID=A0A2T5VGL7_9HYPH|nr:HAD-IA family hydrolase [Breoghania corrubedonensis]PTW62902.1 putative hydrolase of the HAD superfamily [Breoghania corrubedonensis]